MAKIRLFGVEIGDDEDDLGNSVYNSVPIPSELLQKIEAREGSTGPVFLYKKKLEVSDVEPKLSRLFVNKRDTFAAFLNDGEKQILNDTDRGLENIICVDAQGRSYKLRLTIWPSVNRLVITCSDWNKLVKENNAQRGDMVQIWGYREMENLCLAINFKKSCEQN